MTKIKIDDGIAGVMIRDNEIELVKVCCTSAEA